MILPYDLAQGAENITFESESNDETVRFLNLPVLLKIDNEYIKVEKLLSIEDVVNRKGHSLITCKVKRGYNANDLKAEAEELKPNKN